MESIKLTQYSHGAGCGCKISPAILDRILNKSAQQHSFPNLLVGNSSNDDAAVYDIGNGMAVISTTDFFMPIVDDPFLFGQIASVNAISDVYAMGGTPTMAIAILGWPLDKLDPEVAGKVLEGGKEACRLAGIPLAGGHSIDCPEPIFGLAVTGMVSLGNLKRNNTAKPGDWIYLTKQIGVGILTTAQKRGIVSPDHLQVAIDSMCKLNDIGSFLGNYEWVTALTDVTGFGLLGHLTEVADGSGFTAKLEYKDVPVMEAAKPYLAQGAIPGGTNRNWASYGHRIQLADESMKNVLADPQTSGGLLVCVREGHRAAFEAEMQSKGFDLSPIGQMAPKGTFAVEVF